MTKLQAHRGVCTEYPENTMAAFKGAVSQGYEIIELDPGVTADGVFVILHDKTITRTGRNRDGSMIEEARQLQEMTYEEVSGYDFGAWFSAKFRGEKLPLLKEVLQFAQENHVLLKLDNKIWRFSEENLAAFWELLRQFEVKIGITCNRPDAVKKTLSELPEAEIHYDGEVTEEILQTISGLTDKLTVWLPFQCKSTSWVRVPFASEELCRLVKKYAKLGIWIVNSYEDFDEICRRFAPDVVETAGQIKPVKNEGCLVDMHTHSEHSHDSVCPVADMAEAQQKKGTYAFAVTDHGDLLYSETKDVLTCIVDSVAEVKRLRCLDEEENGRPKEGRFLGIKKLAGIEIGEGLWYPEMTARALTMCDYDVVLASLHAVKYKQYTMAYSQIDFASMPEEDIYGYLEQYFAELLETIQTIPCDVVAHLASPLRNINRIYGCGIDLRCFEGKIREILNYIIHHGIALEINTSGIDEAGNDWLCQDWILGIYKEMGGFLITLGSDAHIAANAARAFDWATDLLKKWGFRNLFYFEERKSIQCTL